MHSEISQSVNVAFTKGEPGRNFGKVICQSMKTKQITTSVIFTLFAVVAGAVQTSSASAETLAPNGSELKFVGRYTTGAGLGGAEISAVDSESKRLFITNGAKNTIDIVDISNLKKPKLIKAVSFTSSGATGIQSVAAKNGVVLVAATMASKTAPGRIFVMDINGKLRSGLADGIAVGALPDSVTISPDGKYAIVANEGEPTNYCLTNGALPETTDPLGSVSLINLSSKKPTAKTIDFKSFSDRKNAITYAGGRIFGPNASVAQDLEPEYISVSPDSKYAFVTLQENNAIAVVDIASRSVTSIKALGFKDHSLPGMGMDVSDEDSGTNTNSGSALIKIGPVPVKGMYLPDAIASYTANGQTWLITANEGDARADWPGFNEETRVRAHCTAGLDPTLFTDAANHIFDSNLGRLRITSTPNGGNDGKNGAGQCTELYSFGARSFSIWSADVTRVFDSGDDFEQRTQALLQAAIEGVAALEGTRFDAQHRHPPRLPVLRHGRSRSCRHRRSRLAAGQPDEPLGRRSGACLDLRRRVGG